MHRTLSQSTWMNSFATVASAVNVMCLKTLATSVIATSARSRWGVSRGSVTDATQYAPAFHIPRVGWGGSTGAIGAPCVIDRGAMKTSVNTGIARHVRRQRGSLMKTSMATTSAHRDSVSQTGAITRLPFLLPSAIPSHVTNHSMP